MRLCASWAFRRNATDDGSTITAGFVRDVLLLSPGGPDSQDHLLRLIDRYVDFGFVRRKCEKITEISGHNDRLPAPETCQNIRIRHPSLSC